MKQRKAESNRLKINYQQQQSLVHFFSYTCKSHFQKSIKLTFSGSFAILIRRVSELAERLSIFFFWFPSALFVTLYLLKELIYFMIVIVANVIFLSNKLSFTRLDNEKRREFLNDNSFELRPCLRVLKFRNKNVQEHFG